MIRSLRTGITGLRANQLRLDVIGNNIAGVNTHGFKQVSRAWPATCFCQKAIWYVVRVYSRAAHSAILIK